jgi:hypothetical protein
MSARTGEMLVASFMVLVAGCGRQPPPPDPAPKGSPTPAVANTGQITIHVKGFT